jgi:hypothetical protein
MLTMFAAYHEMNKFLLVELIDSYGSTRRNVPSKQVDKNPLSLLKHFPEDGVLGDIPGISNYLLWLEPPSTHSRTDAGPSRYPQEWGLTGQNIGETNGAIGKRPDRQHRALRTITVTSIVNVS